MKKLFFVLVVIILIMLPIYSFAAMEIYYDGALREYTGPNLTLILDDKKFEVTEGLMPPIIIENRTLVPVREVFETLGGKVEWYEKERAVEIELENKKVKLWIDGYTANVDGEEISIDVPAKIISSKTMVPARFISEKCGLNVEWDDATKTVTINSKEELPVAQINSIEYKEVNGVTCVVVQADSEISGYKYFSLTEPNRLILDVENSNFKDETKSQEINDDKVSTMRFGKQENNVNRIVLDLFAKLEDYVVVQSEDKRVLYLALDEKLELNEENNIQNKPDESETEKTDSNKEDNKKEEDITAPNIESNDNNKTENNDSNIDDTNKQENEKNDDVQNNENNVEDENIDDSEDEKIQNTEEEKKHDLIVNAIKYNSTSDRTRIMFEGKLGEYNGFYLENPKRLVIDISNAKLEVEGPKIITPKNKAIKEIEIAQYDEETVRIVFDLSANVKYETKERTKELQIDIEEPSYRNVEYKLLDESAEITLIDVDIDDLLMKKNKSKKTYTISYSSSKFNTGSGTINVSDSFVKKIAITKTKITINAKDNMSYVAKQSGNNVIITMKKVDKNSDKIILLDAGHGGKDPGSHNGQYYEKNFNLAIMLKLKDLLEDAGYTVYATREKDIALTVDERVELATDEYPEAALYVSVHNNAVENKNYSGTLVMYCPRDTSDYGITNKQFASYVLEELVDELDTINRGFIVVKENDTSKRVLTEVPMPSILCEVAFVSNDEEVKRLDTEEFQESAALAIFNGIEKALEDME